MLFYKHIHTSNIFLLSTTQTIVQTKISQVEITLDILHISSYEGHRIIAVRTITKLRTRASTKLTLKLIINSLVRRSSSSSLTQVTKYPVFFYSGGPFHPNLPHLTHQIAALVALAVDRFLEANLHRGRVVVGHADTVRVVTVG